MAQTLLLDTVTWDLVLDANGNMAVANEPYALAQDVASACRTFQGEVFYDTTIGVPYAQTILGQSPSLSLVKAAYVAAALTVPDVTQAVCYISSFQDRILSGQVQVTDAEGQVLGVNL